jgi:hypothetical protein
MLKCGCQTQPDRNSKDVAWSAYTPAAGKLAAAIATISAKRRPIRDGAERSNEFNRCISPIPSALAEKHCSALKSAERKHGAASEACREHDENSNARVAEALIYRRFIAAIRSVTVETFSCENCAFPRNRSSHARRSTARQSIQETVGEEDAIFHHSPPHRPRKEEVYC